MRKFAKTFMVTLTALCLSVCFLFAGCSKQAGTYVGTSSALTGGKSIELKLKVGDKFEMTIDNTTKSGTWSVSEEDEKIVILVIDEAEYKATFNEEKKTLTMPLIVDGTLGAASLCVLTKK